MNSKFKIIGILAIALLSSCSNFMHEIWTKQDFTGKEFQKILVMNISTEAEASTLFEDLIVERLERNGINATNSANVFPKGQAQNELSEMQIEANIQKGNYDGVLVSYPVDITTREISLTGPHGYSSKVGSYQTYINNGYILTYTDKDYMEEKSYVLETQLFDISGPKNEQTVVWSGQYSITDPSSFYQGSREYAAQLVKTLLKSGMIKKSRD